MTNTLVVALLGIIIIFVLLSAAMIFAYLRENERILRARERSEDALLSLTEQLNLEKERLLLTVKDLAAAKRMAENANRAKSDFLATMSHELRTPLNAILGFSEIIETEMFGPITIPQYVGYAGDVHKSGQHLLKLIDDILDLSKIDAGKVEIHEDVIDIADLVRESLSLVRKNATRNRVALRQETGDAPGLIGDRRLIKQILLNLLSNAIKFTPAGGTVSVSSGADERGMTIMVADTGIGMSDDDIAKAMQPYGQVDSRVARKHQGTGLGLPISRALAKLHGGDLIIRSTPGKGSEISLVMPALRLQAASPPNIARAAG